MRQRNGPAAVIPCRLPPWGCLLPRCQPGQPVCVRRWPRSGVLSGSCAPPGDAAAPRRASCVPACFARAALVQRQPPTGWSSHSRFAWVVSSLSHTLAPNRWQEGCGHVRHERHGRREGAYVRALSAPAQRAARRRPGPASVLLPAAPRTSAGGQRAETLPLAPTHPPTHPPTPQFFTIALETPNGDMALMDAVLEGEGALIRVRGATAAKPWVCARRL